jgi:DNA-binding NarL/FixJ family response regulator
MNPNLLALLASRKPPEAPPASPWRVLLVDDHPLTRRGLAGFVERTPHFKVCGEAGTAEDASELLNTLKPDVVVLDVSLPDMNGIDLTQALRTRKDCPPILIVSMYDDAFYAEWALKAGARGYLRKDESGPRLGGALEQIMRGEIFLSPPVRERALTNCGRSRPGFAIDHLSTRETQVLNLIGDGVSTREIAERLNLSVKTVDSYREHLKIKLSLTGNDLTRYAINWRFRHLGRRGELSHLGPEAVAERAAGEEMPRAQGL